MKQQSYIPCMGIESITSDKAPAAKDFTSEMEGTLESVRENLEKTKEQMKLNANKHYSAVPDYTIGQQVWLATENLWLTHTSQKLTERWLGPYTIIGWAGPSAVKLKLLKSLQIHPVVNVSWITPYPMEGQTLYWPGLVHVTEDRDKEWEVELIQQISFCSFKSDQSRLLTFTRAAFLSIAWKSIFSRGVGLSSHPQGLHLNGLSQFFSFHLI